MEYLITKPLHTENVIYGEILFLGETRPGLMGLGGYNNIYIRREDYIHTHYTYCE